MIIKYEYSGWNYQEVQEVNVQKSKETEEEIKRNHFDDVERGTKSHMQIEDATCGEDKKFNVVRLFCKLNDEEYISLYINKSIYLLNDSGETIEKIN